MLVLFCALACSTAALSRARPPALGGRGALVCVQQPHWHVFCNNILDIVAKRQRAPGHAARARLPLESRLEHALRLLCAARQCDSVSLSIVLGRGCRQKSRHEHSALTRAPVKLSSRTPRWSRGLIRGTGRGRGGASVYGRTCYALELYARCSPACSARAAVSGHRPGGLQWGGLSSRALRSLQSAVLGTCEGVPGHQARGVQGGRQCLRALPPHPCSPRCSARARARRVTTLSSYSGRPP